MYEKYKTQINNEVKFAEILGISVTNFESMRNKGRRVRILKKIDISENLEQEIKNLILQKGYNHKLITYDEFLTLYKQYSNKISEQEFARLIGITSIKYRNMRYYNNKTYVYGKSKKVVPDEKRKKVTGKLINNTDFENLYKSYSNFMTRLQFAELIGITPMNYGNIKKTELKLKDHHLKNIVYEYYL